MKNTPKCRTCSIELQKGFIPDYSHCATYQSKWVEGETGEPGSYFFVKAPGIKHVKESEGISIEAYRCPTCGLLEFYARD